MKKGIFIVLAIAAVASDESVAYAHRRGSH